MISSKTRISGVDQPPLSTISTDSSRIQKDRENRLDDNFTLYIISFKEAYVYIYIVRRTVFIKS